MSKYRAKIFIIYSHKDLAFLKELNTHLNSLSLPIELFWDEKIRAGQSLSSKINEKLDSANIVIFLLSSDSLASDPCKREWSYALSKQKIIRVPVVIRTCDWENLFKEDDIKALPKDGRVVNTYEDKDGAWLEVCDGIKKIVEELKTCFDPNKNFQKELEETRFLSQEHLTLEDIFVFPSLELQTLTDDIDSDNPKTIDTYMKILENSPVFIHGEQSSGKTALARSLCLHLKNMSKPFLYIDLKRVSPGKVSESLFEKEYYQRFNGDYSLWKQRSEKVLVMENMSDSRKDVDIALLARKYFDKMIITLDSDTYKAYFTDDDRVVDFSTIKIEELSRVKLEELIRKRLGASGDNITDAKVDHIEKKIRLVIHNKIMPRYPFFVLTALQVFEGFMPPNIEISSYAHCYYVAILSQLIKSGLDKDDRTINPCINFAKQLAYARYKYKDGEKFDFSKFIKDYNERFVISEAIINRLRNESYGIIDAEGNFRLEYAYYYFLAAYLAENSNENKDALDKLCEKSFTTENHLILIFLVHHCGDMKILEDILIRTMCTLDALPVAILDHEETKTFYDLIARIPQDILASSDSVEKERQKERQCRDAQEKKPNDEISETGGIHDDVYRVLRTNELVKRLLRNHYGKMEKSRISEIVQTIADSGLRLVSLLLHKESEIKSFIQFIKKRNPDADEVKLALLLQRGCFLWTMYNIEKIVDAISFPEIREIVGGLMNKEATPAYKLIGYFSQLDASEDGITENIRDQLKSLLKEYRDNPFYKKVLSIRTQFYMRTHRSKLSKEQAVCSLLKIPHKPRFKP